MILDTQINLLSTDWREIILNWIKNNEKLWGDINNNYEKSIKDFKDILEIFPNKENIFRCFQYFDALKTKVVILGQDPYHGANQATGLCFGVNEQIKKPPSLKNIEKELIKDINTELTDISLEKWAKQGILLLNTSLTVLEKTPGSHIKFWRHFTKFIIDYINTNCEKVVFVAWGAFAHKRLENINLKKHTLIVSSHPSPFSYYRNYKHFPSFCDSKPFIKINKAVDYDIKW